jgi:hypothetical protein
MAAIGDVGRVDGRKAPAMAVEDEPAEDGAAVAALAGLEVHEVAGFQRAEPPGDEPARATEPEATSLPGRPEQVVEAAQGRLPGLGGRPQPVERDRPGIVAHDDDAIAFCAPDPLARRLCDPGQDGVLVTVGR